MDLSKSMEDDKEKLSALGDMLADAMQRLTSNFRLGFGSFVDKVVMPYVSTVPRKLEELCEWGAPAPNNAWYAALLCPKGCGMPGGAGTGDAPGDSGVVRSPRSLISWMAWSAAA